MLQRSFFILYKKRNVENYSIKELWYLFIYQLNYIVNYYIYKNLKIFFCGVFIINYLKIFRGLSCCI